MMIRRAAWALLVVGLLPAGATGQTTPTPETPSTSTPASTFPTTVPSSGPVATPPSRSFREPLPTDPTDPNYHAGAHRSIIRHNPLPQRNSYQSNYQTAGANSSSSSRSSAPNPNGSGGGYSSGGAGRNAEYYDNNTLAAPVDHHPVPVATFDKGGAPDRSEQIAARNAGTQRSNTLENTINTYGRPIGFGYGYGLGMGGGRLYSYPN